jgi:hypothetical protein
MLMTKGFRVLPASWKNTAATLALIRYSRSHAVDDRLVGHVFTTWSGGARDWPTWEPLLSGLKELELPTDQPPQP